MKVNKLFKRVFALLIALISLGAVQAQNVTGTVTDKSGAPIAGASVVVKNSNVGTSTDNAGKFTIKAGPTATLIITSVNFGTEEVAVGGKTDVSVTLLAATQANLNEVVVIGYGTTSRKSVTGAVASLKAKDFNQGVILAPDQLLQSKVAGLEISNTSGQPGAAPTIQIRGNSSIRSSNNPLYVVDGVQLDGGTARPNLGINFGSTPSSNPLLFIDPYSIAQIDVLKDASSAAIYGSRGANGVIVITTKKGITGPMRVEANVSVGFNVGLMKRFEVLDANQFKSALTKYGVPDSLGFRGTQNTDALKAISQHGLTQNYSLAFSGGNEAGRFRAAFLGSSTDGLLKKSGLDKYLGTFNGTYRFLDNKLTFDFNAIVGNYTERETSVSNTAGSEGNIVSAAIGWNPTQPLRLASGLYSYASNNTNVPNGAANPVAYNDAYNDQSNTSSVLANISASYKILKNLEYKFLFGVNHGTGEREINLDGWVKGVANVSGLGVGAIGTAQLTSQLFTHTLSYKTDITKSLNLDAVVGYEYFKTDFSGSNIRARGFNINLDEINRAPFLYTKLIQNAKVLELPFTPFYNPTSELQSYFGRVTLNYMDNIVLTGSLRSDGSSKFGENNKYGLFPAVGARWIASNASFMKNQKLFSNLAIRGSFGITGNQEFGAGSSQEQYTFDANNQPRRITNGNPDLKWETTNSYNIGADFSFMRGRLFSSLDYYHKSTKDILFQTVAIAPAPSSIQFVNLKDARLINSGFEAVLGYTFAERKNFGLEASVNVAYNKNEVQNFKDPNTGRDLRVTTAQVNGQGVSGTLVQVITNNQPVNVYYLKRFEGYDANGVQQVAVKDQNLYFAGDPNPHWLGGLSTTARYKKFSLALNFGGSFGFKIYNNTATSVTNISVITAGRNIDLAAYNSAEGPKSGAAASDRFLENGNYVKLRNATLRYALGNQGKYLKNVTAFVSGTNLFVLTKFSGFDPEVNIDKSNNGYPSRSIEYVPYPTARIVTFGLSFSL